MVRLALVLCAVALLVGFAPDALAKADLVVQSIVLNPAGVGAGSGTLTGTIKNLGDDTGVFVNINVLMYRDGALCDDGVIIAGLDGGDTATEDTTACNPSKPGTYAITYTVDTDSDVDESNESNNSLTVNITWSGPDLVITNIELSPNPAAVGEGTLVATVKNQGSVSTGTLVAINMTMELDGKACDTGLILAGLGAGSTATEDTGACNPTTPGTHTVKFRVDTDDDVAETDETNNTLTKTFTWHAPDLVVKDLVLEPDPARVGEGTLVATIANQGVIDTGLLVNINVRVLLDGEECDTGVIIAGLDAGDDATEETGSCNPSTDGPHVVTVIVDSDSDVLETDEANNVFEKTLSWHWPDLVVTDIVADLDKPKPGDSIQFTGTIKNVGVVDTDTLVVINVRMLLDGVECDTGLIITGLDAGAAATEDTTSCTPEAPGEHTITYEVDVDGDVDEGDEGNNALTKTFFLCAKSETCDGQDDDCDGKTDEDFALGAEACDGDDADLCATGAWACGADKKSVVCVEAPGLGEVCNGADDDCDGETDEEWPDLGTGCDGPDADACATGKVVCGADGVSTACEGDGAPGSEKCNGVDDDCNGLTDETWPTIGEACEASVGGCATTGTVECSPDGSGTLCEAAATPVETCDGTDDDCDGKTDEGFGAVGAPCVVGTGACQVIGVDACAGGASVECDAVAGAPGASELCGDGVDDDCDGATDEGCACQSGTHVACGSDVGACAAGVQKCGADGKLGSCTGQTPPVVETCDGLDNDCDASIDEGCPCTAGQVRQCEDTGGACASGTQTCVGGTWTPCAGATVLKPEACNGLDDDCDGVADEGCPCPKGITESCATPGGACGDFTRVCGEDAVWGACTLVPGSEGTNCVEPNADAGGDVGGPDAGGVPDSGPGADGAGDTAVGPDVPATGGGSTGGGCGAATYGHSAPAWLALLGLWLIAVARRRRQPSSSAR
jgi:uncharacterized protein (TIGR03382 family)